MKIRKELYRKRVEFYTYIQSKAWKQKKYKRLKKDNFECILCKSKENLICHHLTYNRLYNEKINDLITLCQKCHSRIHKLSPPWNQPEFVIRHFDLIEYEPEDLRKMLDFVGD